MERKTEQDRRRALTGWSLPGSRRTDVDGHCGAWFVRPRKQLIKGVTMKSEFPGAVPEIPVRDINTAAAYYQRNLGFTVDWGDQELGLAGISKGNCRMFLANQEFRKHY